MSGAAVSTLGFYGKLPTRGDFIARHLPREFVEPWDGWLQQALAASHTALGADWRERYLTSPLWRFLLAPGCCGAQAWAGVLMPSVDRIGRYFPLTLAAPLGEAPPPLAALAAPWFAALEALALAALEQDLELDELEARLQAIGRPPPAALAAVAPPWYCPLPEPAALAALAPLLTAQLLPLALPRYSAWWSAGGAELMGGLLLCSGLPQAEHYAALLSGDWQHHGWQVLAPGGA